MLSVHVQTIMYLRIPWRSGASIVQGLLDVVQVGEKVLLLVFAGGQEA